MGDNRLSGRHFRTLACSPGWDGGKGDKGRSRENEARGVMGVPSLMSSHQEQSSAIRQQEMGGEIVSEAEMNPCHPTKILEPVLLISSAIFAFCFPLLPK